MKYGTINLSNLPAPDAIEPLDYEQILESMINDLKARSKDYTSIVESDPAYKILEVCAYRELIIRQRVNDGAHAVMLAYATGSDLDNLAATFGVSRKVIEPGDERAIPPVQPTLERDESLRRRTQLSLEGFTTAGPVGSYTFHALSASAKVKDVSIDSPKPGQVRVIVLSQEGKGIPSQAVLDEVNARLNDENIRPLTDTVLVQPAQTQDYSIEAELLCKQGPDSEVIRQAALADITNYTQSQHKLGADITLSGIYAALHQPGVTRVILKNPLKDILIPADHAPYCTAINLILGDEHDK